MLFESIAVGVPSVLLLCPEMIPSCASFCQLSRDRDRGIALLDRAPPGSIKRDEIPVRGVCNREAPFFKLGRDSLMNPLSLYFFRTPALDSATCRNPSVASIN